MRTRAFARSFPNAGTRIAARGIALAIAMLSFLPVGAAAKASPLMTPRRCEALKGRVSSGAIVSTTWTYAGPNQPAFCAAQLQLASEPGSRIRVLVQMPADWNGRFLGIGDHGFGGYIPEEDMRSPLARGFAVFGSDMGHSGAGPLDARWMTPPSPALKDFGWRANHIAAVAAKAVVTRGYGRAPRYSYFQGCSTGGRMAMREAQQFPGDFNGVIVGSAPLDWTGVLTQQLWSASQVLRDGKATPGWIAPERYAWITGHALARCDARDGLKDGLVIDPRRCARSVSYLQCRPGQTSNCLTAAQVEAIDRSYAPLLDRATGRLLYEGLEPTGEVGWVSRLGSQAQVGAHVLGYFSALFGPGWDWHHFDFFADMARARALDRAGAQIDSLSPDLAAFRDRGGKIIQYHGWLDPAMSPRFYPRFYQEVADAMAQGDADKLTSFYRLFMVPGMGHCSGGTGPDSFGGFEQPVPPADDPDHDVLAALVAWVEQGRAPDRIVATKYRNDKPADGVARQMPLCPYPKVARWDGRGDPDRAASFNCADEGSAEAAD